MSTATYLQNAPGRTMRSAANYLDGDEQGTRNDFMVVNTETIPGYSISQVYGEVTGSTVMTRNMFSDIAAGVRTIFGGESKSYTKALNRARTQAKSRAIANARKLGANAIVNLRYESNNSTAIAGTEILCYGTAVSIE